MEYIENRNNATIVFAMIDAIYDNATYLSEIDGLTGDGDHGINMNKGFQLAKTRMDDAMSFSDALKVLSKTLINDIGGSMGPIYGTMFSKMSRTLKDESHITADNLLESLDEAFNALVALAGASVGDKTLLDSLHPAIEEMRISMKQKQSFEDNLTALAKGANEGCEHTKTLVANIGRAARLGERSRGFLDAGATSCCILLVTISNEIKKQLRA